MRPTRVIIVVAALALLPAAPSASAATNVQVAGLQVALQARGHYAGPVDGVSGPATVAAVRAFQASARLQVDGVAGPQTRAALGRLGGPLFGARVLRRGAVGWDVSVLQFLLVSRGHLAAPPDGGFGAQTEAALRRFQAASGLAADGIAGPATFGRLDPSGVRPPLVQAPAPPQSTRYVVKEGDTLTAIAVRHGTSVAELARANSLDPSRYLLASTTIRIPSSRGAAPQAAQASSVRDTIVRWAGHYGVDPRLLLALAWQESGFQNHVVSSAGAAGVMQVTNDTWAFVETVLLGAQVPRTMEGNVRVGTAFMRHLLRLFGGDERLAVGAYYRGPAAVQKHGLGPETSRYVANVLALKSRF